MILHARHALLLAALAACGPGSGDESPGTDSTTGGDSMSSNPSQDSMSTFPSTVTAPTTVPPDPPDPTIPPTTVPPTTEPPDPTTTMSPTTITTATVTTSPTVPTTVSETTDTETTTFDPSDTETIFLVPLDVTPDECDIFGDTCPQGQKCSPFASGNAGTWNSVKCVPIVQDPGQAGDPCVVEGNGVSGIDSCDMHALCFDVDPDTLTGTCVPMCTGSQQNPVCPPNTACSILNGGVLVLCLAVCDPLDMFSCPPENVCVFGGEDFQCVFDSSGVEGQQFDVCEFANDCDPGFVCVESGGVPGCDAQEELCCTTLCDLDLPNLCPPGTLCVPFFGQGEAPPGDEDVGVCFQQ